MSLATGRAEAKPSGSKCREPGRNGLIEAAPANQTLAGTQSLERGLKLVGIVVDEEPTIDELSRLSGLNLSATRRLVAGLANQGFVSIGLDRRLTGGPNLIRFGVQAQGRLDVVTIARPVLMDLAERTGMPSFLGERSERHSVHLHRSTGRHRVVVNTPVGTRRRLAETSLGKALILDDEHEWAALFAEVDAGFKQGDWLGLMSEARDRGFVHHVSPAPDLFHAIAAPVRDAEGRITAAISIVSLPQYVDAETLPDLQREVVTAAALISSDLGCADPHAVPDGADDEPSN